MAESSLAANDLGPWTSKVLCRYFVHGVCREGANCRFSHDRNGAPPDNVCKYYLKGNCSYGDQCRYDHIKPSPTNNNKPSRRTSPPITNQKILDKKVLPINNKPIPVAFGKMVTLKKHSSTGESLPSSPMSPPVTITHKDPEKWVKAAEFIPGQPYKSPVQSTYATATKTGAEDAGEKLEIYVPIEEAAGLLCPFAAKGECRFGEKCAYLHGEICELCGLAVLHPLDKEQNDIHMKECMVVLEKDMELSFAVARSKDKSCGICMDTIMDKQPPSEQRFGIMSNCNHVFCLACIRKWRSNKTFENKTIRSCPECRTVSDFVTPSKYWVESREEKDKLIEGYKTALSTKPCRHFDQGRGECPFNEKCFYLHAYPDGRKAEPQPRRRRHRANAEGELDLLQHIILWDFLEEDQNRVLLELELAEELDSFLTLSEELFGGDSSDSDFEDWF